MRRGAKQANPQLRVIGGQWRGRKLQFPDRPGLRPTGDRIRETLFNWLGPHLHNAKCLDLFAGSGALGIEALSRGAAHCDFVDADREAANTVGHHLNTLNATDSSSVSCDMAERYLRQTEDKWDINVPFVLGLAKIALCHVAAHTAAISGVEGVEVVAHGIGRLPVCIHKVTVCGAAGQRFDPQRP